MQRELFALPQRFARFLLTTENYIGRKVDRPMTAIVPRSSATVVNPMNKVCLSALVDWQSAQALMLTSPWWCGVPDVRCYQCYIS